MKGKKNDQNKPRYSLLPSGFVFGVISVLEHGAKIYEPDNWKKVENAKERYFNALHRHLKSFFEDSERFDEESKLHHLLHATCCLAFIWWLDVNKKG